MSARKVALATLAAWVVAVIALVLYTVGVVGGTALGIPWPLASVGFVVIAATLLWAVDTFLKGGE